jgi:hypothetical protein
MKSTKRSLISCVFERIATHPKDRIEVALICGDHETGAPLSSPASSLAAAFHGTED